MTIENFIFNQLEKQAKKLAENEVDKKDSVTMDIPLFIRMLELAREDIKSDVELHQVVERVLSLKNTGVLTMSDYESIVGKVEQPQQQEPVANNGLDELRRLAGIR